MVSTSYINTVPDSDVCCQAKTRRKSGFSSLFDIIPFQKGLSLPAFLQAYGSEQQCERALFHARWPSGLACSACGGENFCRLRNRRAVYQCNRCKRQVSLLASTIFQATKLPVTVWFLAMYLLSQSKNGISALALGRQLGVSPNTAWLLKHKLMQVMLERDAGRQLEGTPQVDDAYLGGELAGGKRGRGSQNKTPFLAVVQVSEDGQPVVMKLGVVEGFRKDAVQAWAEQNVKPGTQVNTDGLGRFKGFAAAGCKHSPRLTGAGQGSCDAPDFLPFVKPELGAGRQVRERGEGWLTGARAAR